jgi:hypothetical protein
MKNFTASIFTISVAGLFLIAVSIAGCKKEEDPIKYPLGTFPDTVQIISGLNTQYDDYNLAIPQITGEISIIFSSNRQSSGGQFDLEQGMLSFIFDQNTGSFQFHAEMIDDAFFADLIPTAETPRNDFGPFSLYSSFDGYEYFLISSETLNGDLDLFYMKNWPRFGSELPVIEGPFPVTALNTSYNDAYISFNSKLDSVYFISDKSGNFDIYLNTRNREDELSDWFNQVYQNPIPVDSVNSTGDDKCPMIFGNTMIFTSNRPGGMGGFDLYYSLQKNGIWSSPVNFGPSINTSSDEYRPSVGHHPDFTNDFLMFSSNRPGGKGGFDIYFTGVDLYPL